MKTLILFFITNIIATGAFLSALSMSNPWPAHALGWGVWILFIWRLARKSKEAAVRKQRLKLFDEWLRSQRRY